MVYIWVWIETEIYPYRGGRSFNDGDHIYLKSGGYTIELKNLMTVMMIMITRSPITVGVEGW